MEPDTEPANQLSALLNPDLVESTSSTPEQIAVDRMVELMGGIVEFRVSLDLHCRICRNSLYSQIQTSTGHVYYYHHLTTCPNSDKMYIIRNNPFSTIRMEVVPNAPDPRAGI